MATVQTGIATELITFSRTSNATVTDSDGKIKWAPHNLLLASEQFDSASWLKAAATSAVPVVTANAGVAPNGTTTADRVDYGLIDAANDISVVSQIFTAVDTTYRGGVYVKAATGGDVGKKVWMLMYDTAYRGAASVTLTTEWQLLSSTVTLTAGSNRELCIATIGSTNGGENQGAVSVHLWGAHLYRSDLGGMKANTSAYPMYNPTTPKNLLGFTELFSDSWWTKANTTTSLTSTPGPNGTGSATLVYPNSTGTDRVVWRSSAISGSTSTLYTLSIYAKASGKNFISFLSLSAAGGEAGMAFFDLQNGIRTQVGSYFTSATITPMGNGWYRCSATATSASASLYFGVLIADGNATKTVTASGTDGVLLWGAQLSDSASLDAYVPNYGAAPTAAAYYGPRLDADPVTLSQRGLLVEEQRTNSLLYSAQFDNGYWSKTNLNTTGTPAWVNVQTAPDGTLTADKLIPDTTNVGHLAKVTPLGGAGQYTASMYFKAGGYNTAQIYIYQGAYLGTATARLDLETVVVAGSGSPSGTITPVGNDGWYRVTLTVTATGSFEAGCFIGTDGSVAAFAGDGTSGLYIWGAQLEAGSFATSYIPVGSSTAGATRNADVASVSTQAFPYSASESTIVASASPIGPGGAAAGSAVFSLKGASGNGLLLYQPATTYSLLAYVDASNVALGTSSLGAIEKLAIAYNGVANGAVRNGGAVSSVGTTVAAVASSFDFGNIQASYVFNGHIRQITYLPRRISNAELITRTS